MRDNWKKDLELVILAGADNLAHDIAEVVDKFLDEAGHPNKPGHDSGELRSIIFGGACANLITASDEIKRLRACESELTRLRTIVGDIETVRATEGNGIEILCDNPEADDIEKSAAVDVCCDFTEWAETRFYGRTWTDALAKAAEAARAFNAREKASDKHDS